MTCPSWVALHHMAHSTFTLWVVYYSNKVMPLLVFLLNILGAQERLFTLLGPNSNVSQPYPNSKNWSWSIIYLYLLMESHWVRQGCGPSVIRLTSFLWVWIQCVCPLMPSCKTYRLTWVSLTFGMGYLFTAAPAKHSHCSLPWMRGISSPLPFLTFNVG